MEGKERDRRKGKRDHRIMLQQYTNEIAILNAITRALKSAQNDIHDKILGGKKIDLCQWSTDDDMPCECVVDYYNIGCIEFTLCVVADTIHTYATIL